MILTRMIHVFGNVWTHVCCPWLYPCPCLQVRQPWHPHPHPDPDLDPEPHLDLDLDLDSHLHRHPHPHLLRKFSSELGNLLTETSLTSTTTPPTPTSTLPSPIRSCRY